MLKKLRQAQKINESAKDLGEEVEVFAKICLIICEQKIRFGAQFLYGTQKNVFLKDIAL